MDFDNFLSRADEDTLQSLLGRPVLRLLKLLDAKTVTPSRMRDVLLNLRSRQSLLADSTCRSLLLDLLRPEEARRLAVVLGIPSTSEVYEGLRTLRLRHGSDREQALFDFFELLPPPVENSYEVPALQSTRSEIALFKHQRDAARRVRIALAKHPHRVLLHMPTGAGKTRTAMHIIADHLREHEPTLVIWLAYSEELCEQAASEFDRVWYHLGNREIHTHRFWGNRDLNLAQAHDGFVVASLTKLYRSSMKQLALLGSLAGRCSLVVIDEAHQAIAETYQLILDTLITQGRSASLLGLTATPGRTWNDIESDAELAAFFSQNKVTLQVDGYKSPIDYLINEGYLSKVIYRSLLYNGGTSLSQIDIKRIEQEIDIPVDILKKLASDEQRNLLIIVEIEHLVKRHSRIIVFAASVEHAHLIAAALSARGHRASVITGETSSIDRTRLIDIYKEDSPQTQILCNYGVLTTGFDAPRTSAAIIARPTRSLVLYSQMIGRAIRGPRVGGNATAEILTVVDSQLPGFGAVAEAFSNWEDVWSEL